MNWLRKLIAQPSAQHSATAAPAPNIRDTVPTSMLQGRTLVSLWGAHWSSDACNLALFAYELDDGSYAVFPEETTHRAFLECYLIDLDQSFTPISQVTYGEVNDARLIGCAISDLLVPRDSASRYPDTQVLQMASGFGIAQESGAPVGSLPSLYLTDGINKEMISIFATTEWERYLKHGKLS